MRRNGAGESYKFDLVDSDSGFEEALVGLGSPFDFRGGHGRYGFGGLSCGVQEDGWR